MDAVLSRRDLWAAAALAAAVPSARAADGIEAGLAALERRHGGRLGVALLDPATGRLVGRRAEERFAMASTFKVLAAAHVLARVDRGEERLDRRVAVSRADLLAYSPVAEKHVGAGMTMAALCEAAVIFSDNAAGNLVLASLGGPAGLTSFLRGLGDRETRLDRTEPHLNAVPPGDARDTTTPAAMAATLGRLVLGEALSPASRAQLAAWLVDNRTGDKRLRAGLPAGWRVGDKTGTAGGGIVNDVAVVWPSRRGPFVVAAYYAGSPAPPAEREAVLAGVGRLAARF